MKARLWLVVRPAMRSIVRRRAEPVIGPRFRADPVAAKGSLADPLSDRDIEAKLRACARFGRTDWDVERVIDHVWRLDTLADVSSLMGTHG